MSEKVYPVPAEWAARAYVNDAKYKEMYARSVSDPDGFWRDEAQRVDWIKPFTKVKNTRYAPDVSIKWFEDGSLNVAANCLDRHLAKRGEHRARPRRRLAPTVRRRLRRGRRRRPSRPPRPRPAPPPRTGARRCAAARRGRS